MNTFEEIRAKVTANNEAIQAMRAEVAAQVKPLLAGFIAANPQVETIRWRQYTPYFNDGDPCVFRVNEAEFSFVGEDGEGEHNLYDYDSKYFDAREFCSPETFKNCKDLADTIGSMDDEMLELFGDHVKVIVTASGVEVEEYDHD